MRARTRGTFLALVALALSLPLLPAAGAAPSEAPGEPVNRLDVYVGHPTPGARVIVWQQPDCHVHALAWEGAWFTLADAAHWAWDGSDLATAEQLSARARAAVAHLGRLTLAAGEGAVEGWESWYEEPFRAVDWAWAIAGDEDLCVLGLVEVTTGLSGLGP